LSALYELDLVLADKARRLDIPSSEEGWPADVEQFLPQPDMKLQDASATSFVLGVRVRSTASTVISPI
jgi:hypothetical protein